MPTRVGRTSTIYQCPSCDSRYLGEQYCDECGRFCRRIGPGGRCPSCGEPVAVADLQRIEGVLAAVDPATSVRLCRGFIGAVLALAPAREDVARARDTIRHALRLHA